MPDTPHRTAAARSALALLLLAVSFGLVQPTGASSEAQPDIADAADDQLLFGVEPACREGICVTGGGIDLLAAWIDNETATQLEVHLRTSSGDHASGATGTPATLGMDTFTVGFTLNGTAYNGTARVGSDGVEAPVAPVANVTASGSLLTLVLSRAALGDPGTGAVLEGLHVLASRDDPSLPMPLVNDRAPEADAAPVDYTFAMDSEPRAPAANGTNSTTATASGSSTSASTLPPPPTASPSASQAISSTGSPGPGDDDAPRRGSLTSDPGYLALSAAGFVAALVVGMIGLVRWSR